MHSNAPAGRVTSSTGDVDLNGELLGRVRDNGMTLEVPRYRERPALDARLVAACDGGREQAEGVRRMLLGAVS